MAALFEPFSQRGVAFRNRIGMSPMCNYSATEGRLNSWHLVHLGSRAVGGCGLVMVEATAVLPEGRISPADSGLWSDEQIAPLAAVASFLREQGAVAGIQLGHAGRKASSRPPWQGRGGIPPQEGGWTTVAPSPLAFSDAYPVPRELTTRECEEIREAFVSAAQRAVRAGFQLIELHMAHGYLLHEFLSPLTNRRRDGYGGSLAGRLHLPVSVAERVRASLPEDRPLWVRVSATDWAEGGWDIEQTVALASELKVAGADLIDCSSGGAVSRQVVPAAPGYQVPFAERVRRETGTATAAVGLITEADQAEEIIVSGRADVVLLGRALLRDPYWPRSAAAALGVSLPWPDPYGWAVG